MNELIVELLNKYSNKGIINLNPLEFAEAIQTACKAQRNACMRIYERNWERQYMTELIKNAEIERCDYE